MRKMLLIAMVIAWSGNAQATCGITGICSTPYDGPYKGCGGTTWLFGNCTAAQLAEQAEMDRQAAQRKIDVAFHNIELACRMEAITYFQYTGCVEVGVEAYKANN